MKNNYVKLIKIISVILVFFPIFLFLNNMINKEIVTVDNLVAKKIARSATNAIEQGYITESIIDQELNVPDEIPSQKPDSSDIGGILAYNKFLPVGKIKDPSPKGPKWYNYNPISNRKYNFYITCDVESGVAIIKVGKSKETAEVLTKDNILFWGQHKTN